MRTLSIEVNTDDAYKLLCDLEHNHAIRIIRHDSEYPALPGDPLSVKQFQDWIRAAEDMPTLSLSDAKSRWEHKKELLSKTTR
jgi:hypothetical protein